MMLCDQGGGKGLDPCFARIQSRQVLHFMRNNQIIKGRPLPKSVQAIGVSTTTDVYWYTNHVSSSASIHGQFYL